jgi:hypothetical protein
MREKCDRIVEYQLKLMCMIPTGSHFEVIIEQFFYIFHCFYNLMEKITVDIEETMCYNFVTV